MEDSKEKGGDTFVEYKNYRIFYDYKPEQSRAWLITIERFSKVKSDSSNLGTYWFEDKNKGIQWAKDCIDARLEYFSSSDSAKKNLLAPQKRLNSCQ